MSYDPHKILQDCALNFGKEISRIVSFGATRGPVPNLFLPNLTVKEISVMGSTMGSPQDFENMLKLVEEHKIHPVLDNIYSLDQLPEALEREIRQLFLFLRGIIV
ncbi:zinc-binding dehydrogenase [Paenibacillus glacialis]|uniref:Alcohol dehydrogenase-like C-terminal domain-containing protein n=1 Tax=Paenibacillus glacialis TaxID=494026 RepID=A0A162MDC0_9BACL|nr:zinc-binding dehydrogenase [Paenibacillus glacialis]OAB42483.1 hypothetical protein PGLA_12510 [Paenibacillus glacialis]